MKAKIRATGEIVDVKMTKWGMYGDATNMNRLYALHDIEIIEDTTENVNNIDWEQRRYEIAKSMLPVVRSNSSGIMSIKQVARLAVDYADALIEELKGGNRETEESLQSR